MARTRRVKAILFRIFYSTTFTLVFLLTIAFAGAGPIDSIYQSYRRNRLLDVFIIAGLYVLTAVLAVLWYSTRLYTNRQALKDIPKTYIPIDKRELGNRRVGRLIEDCRNRANVVGYLARPRARRIEKEVAHAGARIRTLLRPEHTKDRSIFEPHWGTISHPGWSSPAARETPNLEYSTVVKELTDLIEARAVSLAPVDPSFGLDNGGNAMVDDYIIEALRRPEEQGMRAYISQLVSLNVLEDNSLVVAFLTLYERARFAPNPLSEHEFRQLMRMFAEVLRTMKPLDTRRLDRLDNFDNETDIPAPPYEVRTVKTPSKASLMIRNLGAHASSSSIATPSSTSSSSSVAGSVHRHTPTHAHLRPQLQSTRTNATSYVTAPPRISHDSVRSLSSSEAHQDATSKDEHSADRSWARPTSHPPFFRARSSQLSLPQPQSPSQLSVRSRGSGPAPTPTPARRRSRARATGPRRRSRLGRAMGFASVESFAPSLRSVKSSGSVIRLDPGYDGSREMLPFEYITQQSDSNGADEAGSVRRQAI